jgi:Ser/Thr protein kinase RdoA (MazF antagonist)
MRSPGVGMTLPKPSRVAGWVAARAHAPRISAADARRVVAQYGHQLIGRPANLSLTWRNRLVVVRTTAGRKVLKRYRETSTADSIAHEHSIIDHLEGRGFPSTRLDHTPSGSSVVDVDGHLHASFDFERGRQLAATFLTAGQRHTIAAQAGRTMAGLHRELAGFRPAGSHHLGGDSDSGERARDLAWHLVALDRLCSEVSAPDESAAEDIRWLRERADRHRCDLVEAADRVEQAGLPGQLIHGDFGSHNLLFRRDGTPVVHDFELARFDWRLLDVVIASLRQLPVHQDTFIDAYRREGDLPTSELRLLPWLWRYHLLSGAIRSWHLYVEIGGRARLATARARMVRVESGPGAVLEQWH